MKSNEFECDWKISGILNKFCFGTNVQLSSEKFFFHSFWFFFDSIDYAYVW